MITVEDTGLDEGVQSRNCKICVSAGLFEVQCGGRSKSHRASLDGQPRAAVPTKNPWSPREPGSSPEQGPTLPDLGCGAEGGVLGDSAHHLEGLG